MTQPRWRDMYKYESASYQQVKHYACYVLKIQYIEMAKTDSGSFIHNIVYLSKGRNTNSIAQQVKKAPPPGFLSTHALRSKYAFHTGLGY